MSSDKGAPTDRAKKKRREAQGKHDFYAYITVCYKRHGIIVAPSAARIALGLLAVLFSLTVDGWASLSVNDMTNPSLEDTRRSGVTNLPGVINIIIKLPKLAKFIQGTS